MKSLVTNVCFFLCISVTCRAAEWRFMQAENPSQCAGIMMQGQIAAGDAEKLSAMIAKNDAGCAGTRKTPAVIFDSEGGDVGEALKIGRIIRHREYGAFVWGDTKCISACNLAFIGGVARSVEGAFGIHRPYADSLAIDAATAARIYQDIKHLLKEYVDEMNVSSELVEQMMRISPQDVRFLTDSEMSAMGITGRDPVWEDMKASRKAKELGISKQEFIRRRALIDRLCGVAGKYDDPCVARVLQNGG